MAKPNDRPEDARPDQAADQPPAARTLLADASVSAVRPFLDAHQAYLDEVRHAWQAAQQGLKDAYCAHAKAEESLRGEWKETVTETSRQLEEGLRTALRGAGEQQGAAVAASSRYHTDLSLAHTAASRKWTDLQKEFQDTVRAVHEGYADRHRAASQNFLNALTAAWQSVDPQRLDPLTLAHINRLGGEAMRCAWHARTA
jgi:hypothetical protein